MRELSWGSFFFSLVGLWRGFIQPEGTLALPSAQRDWSSCFLFWASVGSRSKAIAFSPDFSAVSLELEVPESLPSWGTLWASFT